MTVSKTRQTSKKSGSLELGDKVVRFRTLNHTRHYLVHKDLVCRTSSYFRSRLQSRRKPVSDACSVCFEALEPAVENITFCSVCGQNVHETCIDARRRSSCPMCRAVWRPDPVLSSLYVNHDLDGEAMQVYIGWLYTETVHVNSSTERTIDAFNLTLLRCWEVSTALGDQAFKQTIIRTFFTEAKASFWGQSVDFAFHEERNDAEMRTFVVEVFATRLGEKWFEEESDKWPDAFVKQLADLCLRHAMSGLKMRGLEEIKVAYLDRAEETSTSEEDVLDLVSEEEDDDDVPLSILPRQPPDPNRSRTLLEPAQ